MCNAANVCVTLRADTYRSDWYAALYDTETRSIRPKYLARLIYTLERSPSAEFVDLEDFSPRLSRHRAAANECARRNFSSSFVIRNASFFFDTPADKNETSRLGEYLRFFTRRNVCTHGILCLYSYLIGSKLRSRQRMFNTVTFRHFYQRIIHLFSSTAVTS